MLLNVESDGIDLVTDELLFQIESCPGINEGEPQPCWLVRVPPFCFEEIPEDHYEITDPQSCGVKVLLVDEENQSETDLTPYVSAFQGSVRIRDKVNVVAKLEFETEKIAPVGIEQPCWITFQIGNDGIDRVPLDSKLELRGNTDDL